MNAAPVSLHVAPPAMPISIHRVTAVDLEQQLAAFASLLSESVHSGASLGFLPPLPRTEAAAYWLSLRTELRAGSRLLLAAYADGSLIGTGQLALPAWPNARHRAEVQKLIVTSTAMGHGVGGSILAALHAGARERGRSLLLLNTRRGGRPESFYKALGYRVAGVIPGYTVGPAGQRMDTVTLYHELT
jgi:GNAT superfamily N-acetyltransferase